MMILLLSAALQAATLAPAAPADWRTRPLTAGAWTWRTMADSSEAIFSDSRGPQLTIRCTRSTRRISFFRTGALATVPIRVATTTGDRLLPVGNSLLANDPLLDAVAFSRGRLWFDAQGTMPLVLRSSPEPARAIEDCRS